MNPQESLNENSEKRGTEKHGHSNKDTSDVKENSNPDDNIFTHFFHVFFYMVFFAATVKVLYELTRYILEEPNDIIALRPGEVPDPIKDYIADFDPYSITMNAILISACILVFYLVVAFIYVARKRKRIEIGLEFMELLIFLFMSLILILLYTFNEFNAKSVFFGFIFSCVYIIALVECIIKRRILKISDKDSRRKALFLLSILFPTLIVLLFISLGFPHQLFIGFDTSFFEKLLQILIASILISYVIYKCFDRGKHPRDIMRDQLVTSITAHPWSMGMLLLSLFLYVILCLFFAELKEPEGVYPLGVLTLLGIAMVISGGFSIYGYLAQKSVEKGGKILGLLKVKVGTGKEENLIKNLKGHTGSLLLNFLVAISSYIFFKALFKITLPEQLENASSYLLHIERVNAHLSIILLIPLYVFFFRAGSEISQSLYRRLYEEIKTRAHLPPDERRRKSFIEILVRLTKIAILALIAADVIMKLGGTEQLQKFLFESPFDDIIKLAIAVPIAIWILVLILDPFFEKETIEVGSNVGEIKSIGFFFTTMETMTGEQIYIPNAELMAKKIKRVEMRKSRTEGEESYEEKGIMIYFSCTLSYDYTLECIENTFKSLFHIENKEDLKEYFRYIKCEIEDEELDHIFCKTECCPFVFIEDFKDHGVVYRFNFRVKNALYAPIIRGYFMDMFKQKMDNAKRAIYTPLKHEIREYIPEEEEEDGDIRDE